MQDFSSIALEPSFQYDCGDSWNAVSTHLFCNLTMCCNTIVLFKIICLNMTVQIWDNVFQNMCIDTQNAVSTHLWHTWNHVCSTTVVIKEVASQHTCTVTWNNVASTTVVTPGLRLNTLVLLHTNVLQHNCTGHENVFWHNCIATWRGISTLLCRYMEHRFTTNVLNFKMWFHYICAVTWYCVVTQLYWYVMMRVKLLVLKHEMVFRNNCGDTKKRFDTIVLKISVSPKRFEFVFSYWSCS